MHLPAPGPWARYVAVGDSFTEGLWDAEPADPAQCRGWADLLARSLSHRRIDSGQDPLLYANLAIRGKQIRSILGDQLPVALEMKPDLVSLIGGGNDILRPSVDVDQVARSIEEAVVRIRETGADVLLGTGFDASDSPLVGMTRGRTGILNAHLWSIAQRHGAHVLDLWGMRSLHDWRMWADDRIHLTTDGHRRVAEAALVGLGQAPDDAAWDDPLTPLPPVPRIEWVRENAHWLREHVGPWASRRLRRRSSGDSRTAKYPELTPFA
ncbi:SGNH/GDSL hydrolase family protein [Sanguibacter inulinus]|uniref:SGNH/GDSL hydrolase family protein n=1 Tax=Sanguibacter inulinus TaxID=60922 RepID=A0A853EYD6_9MICO|nr:MULTISPECIES: SGNH/GDSL hydrolase family protein [Sanguibacter]KQU00662.1 G-D-S-L family lipolytic protein [Sanguibacter sp. Leaf3]MBF0723148.1 SGNH/GDSL hydrolase family protein [Sanguibacter inulinus]NYS94293.1 SGNH/GDSL hydrolase family protein [Sanguibacter inulinus]